MHLHAYSLKETLFDGEALSISLPASDGEITVLPNHVPLVATLKFGEVKIKSGAEKETILPITSGIAQISRSAVILLVS